ncbi:tyrosine-type recombinase/integrase [Paraburkholderia sediminicola]|uniref:tyrosine-type recombinase/integrase n=1 Tax=Paraburkholderia sediminicola TaxID=458836 RepID=UPI0038BD633B
MYIEQRRLGWYFTLTVPAHLRDAVGQPKIVQSLKTRDKIEAQSIAFKLAGEWKGRFKELEGNGNKPLPRTVDDEAQGWREALQAAKTTGDDHKVEILEGLIHDRAEQLSKKHESDHAVDFHGIATGAFMPTAGHLDDWLDELRLAEKTKDMWGREVKRLAERFKTTNQVTKANVWLWCSERVKAGAANKTITKTLTACRGYWEYLKSQNVHLTDPAPFNGHKLGSRAGTAKRTAQKSYIPFTPAEVVKLWHAANDRQDTALADLIKLGAYTGTRIEEACSIAKKDISADWSSFKVADSKTRAGIREVPIHAKLLPVLKRLVVATKDGFLVDAGPIKNKYGIRSNAIGKRFGRLKDALGFEKDRQTFHSIRKTFVTQLEGAGIPENVAAQIVGHDIDTMTYGTYSSGVPLAVKAAAVKHVKYDWTRT